MADDQFRPTLLRFGTVYGFSGRTRFDLVVNLLTAKAALEVGSMRTILEAWLDDTVAGFNPGRPGQVVFDRAHRVT